MTEGSAFSRRRMLAGLALLVLSACGAKKPVAVKTASPPPTPGSLEWALAGPWRSSADRQLDPVRHPHDTLGFFGLGPGMTVVEMWPGAGWWTEILAPYLNANHGKLYAATFEAPNPDDPAAAPVVAAYRKMIGDKPAVFGDMQVGSFGARSGPLAPAGSAGLVLFFNLDSWMAAGLAEKAFRDAFAALKAGGRLGVVQARAEPGGPQDPLAANGRVQEAFVKQMAAEAGFTFDKASEVNGDPSDQGRTPLLGPPVEPDRMTLRFVKKPGVKGGS